MKTQTTVMIVAALAGLALAVYAVRRKKATEPRAASDVPGDPDSAIGATASGSVELMDANTDDADDVAKLFDAINDAGGLTTFATYYPTSTFQSGITAAV